MDFIICAIIANASLCSMYQTACSTDSHLDELSTNKRYKASKETKKETKEASFVLHLTNFIFLNFFIKI